MELGSYFIHLRLYLYLKICASLVDLCARAAVYEAYLNVKINCKNFDDKASVENTITKADKWLAKSDKLEKEILKIVEKGM